MALIRDYPALFENELEVPHMGDVVERIAPYHYQVGKLAHLDRAQFGADAAQLCAMARGRQQRLPRGRAGADPQPHLQQRGFLERANVGTQSHAHTGIERLVKPGGVHLRGGLSAATQGMRETALGNPGGFEWVGGLAFRKMADREGRHVPGIVLEQKVDALVIHDVAVLDAVSAKPDRVLHRLGVGGMRHNLEPAFPTDLEGSTEFVVKQERVGVEIPGRPHDAAREIELDVVDPILDLLADGFDPTVGAVDLPGMTRGQKVPARGGQEITAGKQPWADMLAGVEGSLPGDVYEGM